MNIYAFDFDGVICDSATETGMSGYYAAKTIWDDLPEQIDDDLIHSFRLCRPVLETGFQSILIIRLLQNGFPVNEIINNFHEHMQSSMTRYSLTETELIKRFGHQRDLSIKHNFEDWLSVHSFYPGVVDKINALINDNPVFIITTKEKRFAYALTKHASLNIAEDHVFGLESGKKVTVLSMIHEQYPQATIHFIEDRLKTIQNMNMEYTT